MLMIASAFIAVSFQALAQQPEQSGADLFGACRVIASEATVTTESARQAGVCSGELTALRWFAPGVNDDNLRSCIPADVTHQQLAKIVVGYFDQNKSRLQERFEGLALEAFAHAWPCPKERRWYERWFNRD
jgi:hypothetical protein